MQRKNDPFQDHWTLRLGTYLRICYFNIEGSISIAKSVILSKLMRDESVDIIALEKTHTAVDVDLHRIAGFVLLGALHHKQFGVGTYLKLDISSAHVLS